MGFLDFHRNYLIYLLFICAMTPIKAFAEPKLLALFRASTTACEELLQSESEFSFVNRQRNAWQRWTSSTQSNRPNYCGR